MNNFSIYVIKKERNQQTNKQCEKLNTEVALALGGYMILERSEQAVRGVNEKSKNKLR